VAGGWKQLHNVELRDMYYSPSIIIIIIIIIVIIIINTNCNWAYARWQCYINNEQYINNEHKQ
jgi:hypothetical protein